MKVEDEKQNKENASEKLLNLISRVTQEFLKTYLQETTLKVFFYKAYNLKFFIYKNQEWS